MGRGGIPDLRGGPLASQRLLSPPRGAAGGFAGRTPLVTAASHRPPLHKWLSGIGSQFASGAGSLSDHGSNHASFLRRTGGTHPGFTHIPGTPRWSCLIVVAECGVCCLSLSLPQRSSLFSFLFSLSLPFHVCLVIGEVAFYPLSVVLMCVTWWSLCPTYRVILTRF